MYRIVRHYYGKPDLNEHVQCSKRTIASGLTLEQAQAHCGNPETSSRTCTGSYPRSITRKRGEWFDGYEET